MKLLNALLLGGLLLAPYGVQAADWKDILAEKNWSALLPEVKWKDYLPGAKGEPGVVATVNGVPIEFREVEGLYDMNRAIHDQGGYESDLEGLRAAYAGHLLELITQRLVHQELQARKLAVDDADVAALEGMVREGYAPGEFERTLALDGIQPTLWREQLRSRLELELFEAQVLKNEEFTPEDQAAWNKARPLAGKLPERYVLRLVLGENRPQVEAARKAGISTPDQAAARPELGLKVVESHLGPTALPETWEKDIPPLKPGQLSPVRPLDAQFGYIVLVERKKAEELSPLALYAYMEEDLRRQARERGFDAWLEQAVGKADIRVARPLLPGFKGVASAAARAASPAKEEKTARENIPEEKVEEGEGI